MKSCLQKLFDEPREVRQKKRRPLLPKKILFFSFLFLFSIIGKAQNVTLITGNVVDSGQSPLQGVTVTANASKRNAITDQNSNYSIQIRSADKSLTFSFVGMKPITQTLNGQTNYNITLTPDNTGLSEVVVVGYGTQKKGSLTGSIATVTSKDLDRVHGVLLLAQVWPVNWPVSLSVCPRGGQVLLPIFRFATWVLHYM